MNEQARKLQAELRLLNLIADDLTKQTGICLMSYDEKVLKAMIKEKDHHLTMLLMQD
mgnify:FL=1